MSPNRRTSTCEDTTSTISTSTSTSRTVSPSPPNISSPLLPSSPPQQVPTSRLHHLDYLRTFLTTLVIYHHTAIPYGGLGSWQIHSSCFPPISSPLALFNAVDQTFFMALFYWLAGYFSHLELSKHAPSGAIGVARWRFIVKRAKRLVVPSIVYTLLLQPIVEVTGSLHWFSHGGGSEDSLLVFLVKCLVTYYSNLRGIHGPVWFCMLLFVFDIVASVVFPCLTPRSSPSYRTSSPQHQSLTHLSLTIAVLTVILSSVLIRLAYPIGTNLPLLNIQPAFLPQYIFAYSYGHFSASLGQSTLYFFDFTPWPKSRYHLQPQLVAARTLGLSLLYSTITLSLIAFLASALHPSDSDAVSSLSGGLSLPALLTAIWSELSFIAIGPAVVAVFSEHPVWSREVWTVSLPWWRWSSAAREVNVARYAFATFLVHPVISMFVEVGVERTLGCENDGAMALVLSLLPSKLTSGTGRGAGLSLGSVSASGIASGLRILLVWTWNIIGPIAMTAVVGTVNAVLSWGVAMGMLDLVPALGRWV